MSAPAKVVRLRRWAGRPDEVVEVTLEPTGDSEWRVHRDGEFIGTIGRYTGNIGRKVGRLRSPGVERTLWTACGNYPGARTMGQRVSRADAIRWLLPV
jgi:hypothetical protein